MMFQILNLVCIVARRRYMRCKHTYYVGYYYCDVCCNGTSCLRSALAAISRRTGPGEARKVSAITPIPSIGYALNIALIREHYMVGNYVAYRTTIILLPLFRYKQPTLANFVDKKRLFYRILSIYHNYACLHTLISAIIATAVTQ